MRNVSRRMLRNNIQRATTARRVLEQPIRFDGRNPSNRVSPNAARLLGACLGGGLGTAIDVAVLTSLVERGAPVAASAFAGALAGAGVCFAMNKYVAFRDHTPVHARQLGAFALVAVASALIMALSMQLVAVVCGVPYLLAKILCAAVVFAVWSYPAQKRVFRAPELSPAASMA